MHKATILSLPW